MMLSRPDRRTIVIASIVLALVLALFWQLYQSIHATEPARYGHEQVLAALPEVADANCRTVLGEFRAAPGLRLSHMEGATAKTSAGYIAVAGFSHWQAGRLLASARVDRLLPDSLEWRIMEASSPTIASHIQGAAFEHELWVAGGFIGQHPGGATRDTWHLNTESGEWEAGPKLPSARASGGFVEFDGRLHYISGLDSDRQTDLTDHLSLDARNPGEWRVEASFPRTRNHFQAVAIGSLIYAVGGLEGHDKSKKDVPFLDVYHPEYRQWLPMADLPEPRSHAELATFVHENRIIVAGGRTAENAEESLDSVIEYNPYRDEWYTIATLPEPRYSPFARIIGDRFYIGGGGLVWKEPRTDAWVADVTRDCVSNEAA